MTYYPPDVNPGITLYNNWLHLLQAQADLVPSSRKSDWDNHPYPTIAYGDLHTGITVYAWDAQQRPILGFGGYYRRGCGIHRYFMVNADGEFRLMWPHGFNHDRLQRSTFLGWGRHGGQYIWYVSPLHTSTQSIDTEDWRTHQPYLREKVLVPSGWNSPIQKWMRVCKDANGNWDMEAVPNGDSDFLAQVAADKARVERAYLRAQRKEIGTRTLSVRDGTKTLTNKDAALHIAALLDVTVPAKAVPLRKDKVLA